MLLRTALLLTAVLTSSATSQSLCPQLRSLLAEPTVASAHWGISVTQLDGTALCGINDAQLFRPASNNKIFTTATAIALLGPRRQFTTEVAGALNAATGTIEGDLTLLGGGDANLDSNDLPYLPASQRSKIPAPFAFHNLDELAQQLVAKGVHSVAGDLIGDDTMFPYEPYAPSWNADDFTWGYGAPISALSIADNQLRLTITPGKAAGQAATVELDQHGIAYYTIVAEASTAPAKSAGDLGNLGGIGVERLPGSRTLRIYGTIPAGSAPDHEEIAIDEPAAYAAMAFQQVLAAHGITVSGTARARHKPVQDGTGFAEALRAPAPRENAVITGGSQGSTCVPRPMPPILASHVSAPLLDDMNLTNKISQNLHAELMLHQLGRSAACAQGSNVEGARIIRAYLLHAGVQQGDFLLYDGSGLSDHDLVTPRALTTFLDYASTQPWFADWKRTLPDGGADGTLSSRFPTLKGRLSAKTGTLGESRALSGYLTTRTGKTIVFSILVDTHLPGNADRVIMDKAVNIIADEP